MKAQPDVIPTGEATPQRDPAAREIRPRDTSHVQDILARKLPTPDRKVNRRAAGDARSLTPAPKHSTPEPADSGAASPSNDHIEPASAEPATSALTGSRTSAPTERDKPEPAGPEESAQAERVTPSPAEPEAPAPAERVTPPPAEPEAPAQAEQETPTAAEDRDTAETAKPVRSAPRAPEPSAVEQAGGSTAAESPAAGSAEASGPAARRTREVVVLAAVESAVVQVRRTARDTWTRIVADPARTPELLALTAVQTIGPRAAAWARDVRESYPTATPDGVARLAVRQFTRRGGVGSAVAAVSGAYAPVALWGTAAYHHAELVLHVAAAYGQDPGDPARAADLLVLTKVHPEIAEARAAIAAALEGGGGAAGTATTRRLGRTLAVQAGGWAALRAVSRRFPGSALLVATITSRAATETLGVRATTYYRATSR